MENYKEKLSELLSNTSEERHLSVYIPLDLSENQGLSTLQMLTIVEIWQHPVEKTINIMLSGYSEPQKLDNYKECIPYVYNYIHDQFNDNGLQ